MMKAGKIPEWNIPPSKEVCHRNLNSAKTRLRRPESQKIINDANQLKKDVAKVATQDEGIEFTRYNMDQFHIGQERDLLKTGRPNINPQALLVPSSRVKTPPISFFGTGRRPSTSPCQTNHLLLKGNNVENDYIIHNSHLGRTNRTPVLTKTEFSRTLDQHSLKGASGFSPKGVLSLPTAQFPLHSSNHNAVDRTSGHVTSQARLQVPECREGTPRDSKRTDPEDSQMSRVYFLTQEPQVKPQKSIVVMTEADSDEYDTDCEPEIASAFRADEFRKCQSRLDVDIGHLTYEKACKEHKVKPRRRVLQQLWKDRLDLHHAGLSTLDAKAIAAALNVNSRVETVVMSDCHLVSEALSDIFSCLHQNCFITELDMSGSVMDLSAATACGNMLAANKWLMSLNLSNCSIGDNEIVPIAHGIKENQKLENINLSQNSISLSGGLVIGRVLGQTANLKVVNLSWNHIRGGGAVGVCNSLLTNKSIEDLNLSWNGIGFEGCLALGESLRANRTLRRLNLENNRINWDCAPYISKSLNVNTTLEILELGLNPISMEGCEEILTAVCKLSSKVQYISLAGIPINTKIALIATDIAKLRQFNLIHGGIFSSKDVLGIQRVQQEDPFSLLVRYMSTMGIRVMDLFRIFDKDNKLCVSRERFIQGLKRVRVPLDDKDIMTVAKRLQLNKRGNISYQELATLVRNRIREDRLEDKRQEIIQRKKREERKRILQSDKPLNAPSHFNFMPNLYSMYDPSERDSQQNLFTPGSASFSRAGSIYTPLPPIKGGRSSATDEVSRGRKTPMTLVRQNASLRGVQSPSIKSITKMTNYSSFDKQEPEGLRGVSYVSQIKWHQATHELLKRRQSFL